MMMPRNSAFVFAWLFSPSIWQARYVSLPRVHEPLHSWGILGYAITESDLRFTSVISEDLPVPPVQQVKNLILFIGIIQKVKNALIESFRVCGGVCPTEN